MSSICTGVSEGASEIVEVSLSVMGGGGGKDVAAELVKLSRRIMIMRKHKKNCPAVIVMARYYSHTTT